MTPAAEAMVQLIEATITRAITPLVAVIERQAGEIADLREDRGRLTAELERAASTVVTLSTALEARTAAQDAEALRELFPSRWRVLAPWLLVLAVLVGVVGLLAWPR